MKTIKVSGEESLYLPQEQNSGLAKEHICDKYCNNNSSLRANAESVAIQPLNGEYLNCPLTPSPSPAGRGENKDASLVKGGGTPVTEGLKGWKNSDVKNLVPYYLSALVPSKEIPPTPLSWIIRGVGKLNVYRHLTGYRPTENPLYKGGKKAAFTLAEVLITLGIIGVVAAMTLPALIQKQNEREIISRLQKTYSILSQALVKSQIEYGFFETWESFNITNFTVDEEGMSTEPMKNFYYNIIKPELKVLKECEDSAGCWHKGKTKLLNGETTANSRDSIGFGGGIIVFRLADGTNIEIDDYSAATITTHMGVNIDTASYVLFVDANGDKKPNQIGRDIFIFVMTKKGLLPAGKDSDNHCSLSDSSGYSGFTCAARVLTSGKIDY